MSYYADLTNYTYTPSFCRPKTLNVAWLDSRHPFETARPPKWMIKKLWAYCQFSLAEDRGFHECNLPDCRGPARKVKPLYFGGKPPTEGELHERYDQRRRALHSRPGRLAMTHLAEELVALDRGLSRALRGHSKMTLGVHPDSGDRIDLGYAEIRVFGQRGKIYAAPNMLYHYVTVHHYKPPDSFVQALKHSPCPPDPEYLDRLSALRLPLSLEQSYRRSRQAQD